jgi:hypothetical protein
VQGVFTPAAHLAHLAAISDQRHTDPFGEPPSDDDRAIHVLSGPRSA